jgi:hypothetical protein
MEIRGLETDFKLDGFLPAREDTMVLLRQSPQPARGVRAAIPSAPP